MRLRCGSATADLTPLSRKTERQIHQKGHSRLTEKFSQEMALMENTKNTSQVTPVDEMSYEQAFIELESIIKALEDGQASLQEALDLFERGQALAQRCAALLDQTELRVRQLTGDEILPFSGGDGEE